MVSLAVAGRRGWRASDVELRHEAPSYTSTTLRRFEGRGYAPAELFFLIGADAFADIGSWRDFPRILDRAHFVVVSRPGQAASGMVERLPALASRMVPAAEFVHDARPSIILIDRQTADVSSTAIRSRLAHGEPIDGMVDPRVQQHIEQHRLYRPATPDRRIASETVESRAGRLHGED
jgi:nicotinate-nucleotide adenylyltransferase